LTIIIALSPGHGTMFGLQSTNCPELFSTRVRYTGASLDFQLSAAIGDGLAPIIATALAARMGGTAGGASDETLRQDAPAAGRHAT
jgi:MFS transporter, MHS family, shikimate and dehydroshikimate transport protein